MPTTGPSVADWIPLAQSLIWPAFVVGIALRFRREFRNILTAVSERIASGASVDVGPSGIKIGATQKPPDPATALAPAMPETRRARPGDGLPHPIYLTHTAVRQPSLDRATSAYYEVTITLDADEPDMLNHVTEVTYHLHPTFPDPDRTSADRKTQFAIAIAAWGEFNMTAEITFADRPKLIVERYINFLPTSAK